MNNQKQFFKKMIRSILIEESIVETEETPDSLDAIIDDYFVDFESEAIKEQKNESFFRRFLREEKDEEENNEDEDSSEESEEPVKDIDLESFTSDINRLITNYDSLLDIKNVILRRAVNFLKKNYSIDVSESFKQILEQEYSLAIGKTSKDFEEDFQAPSAERVSGGTV